MGLTAWIFFPLLCASVGFGCAEALAPAGVREEDRLAVAGVRQSGLMLEG